MFVCEIGVEMFVVGVLQLVDDVFVICWDIDIWMMCMSWVLVWLLKVVFVVFVDYVLVFLFGVILCKLLVLFGMVCGWCYCYGFVWMLMLMLCGFDVIVLFWGFGWLCVLLWLVMLLCDCWID